VVLVVVVVPVPVLSLPRLAVVDTAILGTAGSVPDVAAAVAVAVAVAIAVAAAANVTGIVGANGDVVLMVLIMLLAANCVGKRG